jgi:hypothetical protein
VIQMLRAISAEAPSYLVDEGLLYRVQLCHRKSKKNLVKLIYVPPQKRESILREYHNGLSACHLGLMKTFEKIRERYFWPGLYSDAKSWIDNCQDCRRLKSPRSRGRQGLLQPLPPAERPFERVAMDILGPLPTTENGNKYILVFSDYLTRWTEAFAVPETSSKTVARIFVEEIVCRHGAPEQLLTDRGSNFMSKLSKQIYSLLRIKKLNTSAYHPQTDGLVERFNHTLCSMIASYVNEDHDDWDAFLPFALLAYRTSVQDSIKETPFFMLYGRNAKLPADISNGVSDNSCSGDYKNELVEKLSNARNLAVEKLKETQIKMKERYDSSSHDVQYNEGDLVFVYVPPVSNGKSTKFAPRWRGPYPIQKKKSEVTYSVAIDSKSEAVHVNRMKLWKKREEVEVVDGSDGDDSDSNPEGGGMLRGNVDGMTSLNDRHRQFELDVPSRTSTYVGMTSLPLTPCHVTSQSLLERVARSRTHVSLQERGQSDKPLPRYHGFTPENRISQSEPSGLVRQTGNSDGPFSSSSDALEEPDW